MRSKWLGLKGASSEAPSPATTALPHLRATAEGMAGRLSNHPSLQVRGMGTLLLTGIRSMSDTQLTETLRSLIGYMDELHRALYEDDRTFEPPPRGVVVVGIHTPG